MNGRAVFIVRCKPQLADGFTKGRLKAEWGRGVPGYVTSFCTALWLMWGNRRCHRSQHHPSLGCVGLGATCSWSSGTWLLPFGGGFSICERTQEVCPGHCDLGTSERICSGGDGGKVCPGKAPQHPAWLQMEFGGICWNLKHMYPSASTFYLPPSARGKHSHPCTDRQAQGCLEQI